LWPFFWDATSHVAWEDRDQAHERWDAEDELAGSPRRESAAAA